jgi:hypothetical protein
MGQALSHRWAASPRSKSAIFEPEDFGAAVTPELRQQEERLRAQVDEHGKTVR